MSGNTGGVPKASMTGDAPSHVDAIDAVAKEGATKAAVEAAGKKDEERKEQEQEQELEQELEA